MRRGGAGVRCRLGSTGRSTAVRSELRFDLGTRLNGISRWGWFELVWFHVASPSRTRVSSTYVTAACSAWVLISQLLSTICPRYGFPVVLSVCQNKCGRGWVRRGCGCRVGVAGGDGVGLDEGTVVVAAGEVETACLRSTC